MTSPWLPAAALALGLAVAAAGTSHDPAPAPPAVRAAAAPADPEPVAAPIVPQIEVPAVSANALAVAPVAHARGSIRFPDGSERPALNGVTEALEIPWPAGRPYSPITEQLTHNGADWYHHADGTFTTTIVRTETVSGQVLQIPLCFTPKPGHVHAKLR